MALSKTTQDHDEIRAWAEKRGGRPADVASTEKGEEVGIIRLEFPDAPNANDDNLKEIDWEPFFKKFDESGLEMVYQEVTAEGAESNFYKFVHPENVSESAKKSASATPSAKTAAKKTSSKSASRGSSVKTAAKKAPAKVAAKKAPAKVAAKKTAVKKSAAKSTGSKGYQGGRGPNKSAKKVSAKNTAPKKAGYKAPAKKAAAKKAAAKKTAAKKTGSKGYQGGRGPNKAATKAAAKKTSYKTSAKKAVTKKSVAKKTARR